MSRQKLNKQIRGHGKLAGFPRLLGGCLCLDFVNTIEGRISQHPEEFLAEYEALVRWAYHVDLLTDEACIELLKRSRRQPKRAVDVFKKFIALRETIHRVFLALVHEQMPSPKDLMVLQQVYAEGLSHANLETRDGGVRWVWATLPELEGIYWAVARSAVELLTSLDARRVKQCPGCADCGWLFLDTSKSGTRQWCSMEGCGSRAKMRRQYQRHQETV
jgi:predicted RNA-binding Zn ribbon-like protein